MKFLSRVVWSEGMYLAPQHFQIQSRYFEDSIAFLASVLWQEPWGLLHLEMDAKAIANGTVSLLHASGMFPDGLTFDMPASDALCPPRSVASMATASESEVFIHLVIPARRNALEMPDMPVPARYSSMPRLLRDETNGMDEYEVDLARKNIGIAASGELSPELLSLPIARIVRGADGSFAYDPDFVPCSLRMSASDALMLLVKKIIESLAEKSVTVARPVREAGQLAGDSLPMDIANYWFLHALHSALPVLQHLSRTRHAHPAECFRELLRLSGALCTFALHASPQELPAYDHANPGPGFRALHEHIARHLEIIVPANTVQLVFSPMGPYLYSAPVTDERCLRRARWVLGLRSSMGESDQMRLAPRLIKVCSERFVPELVKRALPGMTLTHLPIPPASIRAAADMQYYAVDTAGPCWQHILQTRAVGIYIPGEFTEPVFTLTAIFEQAA